MAVVAVSTFPGCFARAAGAGWRKESGISNAS